MPNARPKTKRYVYGNDLFLFFVFCLVIKKTGNTGMEKLYGMTHSRTHGAYLLYRLFGDDSTKSYEEEKTHRISTNNSPGAALLCSSCMVVTRVLLFD